MISTDKYYQMREYLERNAVLITSPAVKVATIYTVFVEDVRIFAKRYNKYSDYFLVRDTLSHKNNWKDIILFSMNLPKR